MLGDRGMRGRDARGAGRWARDGRGEGDGDGEGLSPPGHQRTAATGREGFPRWGFSGLLVPFPAQTLPPPPSALHHRLRL